MTEDEDEIRTAERLETERPLPPAPFRQDLSGRVAGAAVRLRIRRRPEHLWPIAIGMTVAGLIALAIAAMGI